MLSIIHVDMSTHKVLPDPREAATLDGSTLTRLVQNKNSVLNELATSLTAVKPSLLIF